MTTRKVRQVCDQQYLEQRSETLELPDGTTFQRGDEIAVRGARGTWKLSYCFRGEPVLYGGEPGYGHLRSFPIARLSAPRKKHRRNLSEAHKQALRDRLAEMREAKR